MAKSVFFPLQKAENCNILYSVFLRIKPIKEHTSVFKITGDTGL